MKPQQSIKKRNKTESISIRITSELKKWLNDNGHSYTALFERACWELGYGKE